MQAQRYRILKEANREIFRDELERGVTVLRARPRALFVELTRFCNLACPMCRKPGEIGREQTMRPELFSRVAEELFPTAELVDLRGWGESLILPELPQRLEVAASYGCEIRIATNLSFHRPEVLNSLAMAAAYVGVSLDGASVGLVAELRGGARLPQILNNLHYLGKLYRASGISSRLRLYVTCQRPNLETLDQLVEVAAEAGVGILMLAPVTVESSSLLSISGHKSQLARSLELVRDRARKRNITVLQTANLFEGQWDKQDLGACIHPWTYCYITFDGRVGFCDHLIGPHGDSFLMGDLHRNSFEEIWNGDDWVRLRREHLGSRREDAPFFSECAWCYRNRFVDFEDLLEPAMACRRQYVWPSESGCRGALP